MCHRDLYLWLAICLFRTRNVLIYRTGDHNIAYEVFTTYVPLKIHYLASTLLAKRSRLAHVIVTDSFYQSRTTRCMVVWCKETSSFLRFTSTSRCTNQQSYRRI